MLETWHGGAVGTLLAGRLPLGLRGAAGVTGKPVVSLATSGYRNICSAALSSLLWPSLAMASA
jgi:hypothetical protein